MQTSYSDAVFGHGGFLATASGPDEPGDDADDADPTGDPERASPTGEGPPGGDASALGASDMLLPPLCADRSQFFSRRR